MAAQTALLSSRTPLKPEHIVFPALPPLVDGMRVMWVGEYVWDDNPHPEAWARDRHGRLWVSAWVGNDWTPWTPNDAKPA